MKALRKKYVWIFIALCIVNGMMFLSTVKATTRPYFEKESVALYELGLFRGISDETYDPDLSNELTREVTSIMIIRLYGEEEKSLALSVDEAKKILKAKFRDVSEVSDWAVRQVAYGVKMGYINGYEDSTFRPKKSLTGREYCALHLKMLGYTFTFAKAGDVFAKVAGILDDEKDRFAVTESISKDTLVGISYRALTVAFYNTEEIVAQRLVNNGIVPYEQFLLEAPEIGRVLE